jgi:hypothetical protein
MTIDEAIKHAEEVAEEKESEAQELEYCKLDWKHEANKCAECSKEHRQLAEWLKELKQLREQTRWIPVSEKLPEDYQRVLVTVVNYWGIEVVRVAEYSNQKKIFQIKESNDKWKVGEEGLLAWLPLPKPYEEESEDK